MSIFDGLKTKKAIETILLSSDNAAPEFKEAVAKIKTTGPSTIPKLIAALEYGHNIDTFESLLVSFVSNKTLPQFVEALGSDNGNVVTTVARVLGRARGMTISNLIPAFKDPRVSKAALVQILTQHRESLDSHALFELIDTIDKDQRQTLFRFLQSVSNEQMVSEMLARVKHADPAVRQLMARMLGRVHQSGARDALETLVTDEHKAVRLAALESLSRLQVPLNVEPLCKLLRDPDLTIQSKAIETLAQLNDPDTIKYLIDILQDDSEYVRRAAVEVLNEIASEESIKDLLNALRDSDWWVRVRAADALGSIGGPKVVDAVLTLMQEGDEFLRRTAVEILNTTEDDRAFDQLRMALRDDDWWVRERAADALAAMKDERAVPDLVKMLVAHPDTHQVVCRALSALVGRSAVDSIVRELNEGDHLDAARALASARAELPSSTGISAADEATRVMRLSGDEQGQIKTRSSEAAQRDSATTMVGSPAEVGEDVIDLSGRGTVPPYVDPSNLQPGDVLADRYKIIKHIGEGAFGIVVLVEDMMVSEQIILKFLSPRFISDENMIRRFTHELRYARKITHPNVIRIYDFVTFGKTYAISMEYFPSYSLASELAHGPMKDLRQALNIIKDICRGMKVAHRANVIHRDLKPANILLDDQNVLKIVDFGLAAAASHTDSRVTRSGVLVGTPTYMSPEQARGLPIDLRTDIYSLGIIMYEMFVGRPPYIGGDSMAILFKHVEGNPTPPRELNPNISAAVEAMILKAMSVDRDKRYQSFDELYAAVEELEQTEATH